MALSMRIFIAVVVLIWAFAGLGQTAYALGKHHSNVLHAQRHSKKNSSPYDYLAPKKQKKQTSYYRSPVTGQLLYGKQKK